MSRLDESINVIAMIGHADADLLPFFLAHYRQLGVDGFVLAFHGDWDRVELERLDGYSDVHIWDVLGGEYSEGLRLSVANSIAKSFKDKWIVLADADEFLELPYPTFERTIRALQVLGLDCLPALLVQRLTADGSLPVMDPCRDLQSQFPLYSLHLCEEMGLDQPVWKTEFPLAQVTDNFLSKRGNHLPPNGRLVDQAPIRGIVHHFKWREALRLALTLPRDEDANGHEMQVYGRWLDEHGEKLPLAGARPCSAADLRRRGFLVRPDSRQLRFGALQRKAWEVAAGNEAKRERVTHQLRHVGPTHGRPGASKRERDLVDPANLLLKPGRICLVTFEIAPPRSGGIGTAMTVLAERLSAAGHVVDVLFCPFSGPARLWEGWYEYWSSRQIHLHYMPRRAEPNGVYADQNDFCRTIADTVAKLNPDVVHCVDAGGYGAVVALLKASGLNLTTSRLVVTAHGSSAWHNRGNHIPWREEEAEHGFCHDLMMSLADVVCFPSDYILSRTASADLGIRAKIVVANGLSGATRSFAGIDGGDLPRRPVDELVFFGRVEPRKGYDRFEAAIMALMDRGYQGFEVTLLGKFGDSADSYLTDGLMKQQRIVTRHIANFNHVDAVNYLKGRNCLAIIASRRDNLPYTVYECLENGIPLLASPVGGIPSMVHLENRSQTLVADDHDALVDALADALDKGGRPARLAFDPALAEIEHLAIHARLVDEARKARHRKQPCSQSLAERRNSDLAALVYGGARHETTRSSIALLAQHAAAGQLGGIYMSGQLADGIDVEGLPVSLWNGQDASAIMDAVARIKAPYLLFCHAGVIPHPQAIDAMSRLIEREPFDAVVSDFQAGIAGCDHPLTAPLPAPGGPAVYAPSRNVFGAGLFLIKRSALERAGGLGDAMSFDRLAHWVLLNRLSASGGRVVGIPKSLATVYIDHSGALVDQMDDHLAEALVRPWIEAAAPHAECLIRKAVVADFGHCPTMWKIKKELDVETSLDVVPNDDPEA